MPHNPTLEEGELPAQSTSTNMHTVFALAENINLAMMTDKMLTIRQNALEKISRTRRIIA